MDHSIFTILVQFLLPVSVCVILPVLVVWIIFRSVTNRDNKNAEILIKAIENNPHVNELTSILSRGKKTLVEVMNSRLLVGCIFTLIGIAAVTIGIIYDIESLRVFLSLISGFSFAIGIAYLIVWLVNRKSLKN